MITTQSMIGMQHIAGHNWESLVDALRSELQEYGALLNLLNEHQASIMDRNTDKILSLNDSIDDQISASTKVREDREEMVDELAQTAGMTVGATIKQLVTIFPEQAQHLLTALVDEVIVMIQKTQYKARQNQMLIKKATELTEELLESISKRPATKTYTRKGNLDGGVRSEISCINATA